MKLSLPSRRQFLRQGALMSLAFSGLRHLYGQNSARDEPFEDHLRRDKKRILDLPSGFSYHAFSKTGEEMNDGLLVPGAHDGMGSFEGGDGRTILVRNHELDSGATSTSPFGEKRVLLGNVDVKKLYDAGRKKKPGLGGTTTLVYDTRRQRLEKHFLSLGGTYRNCAGGVTPWKSWITCEEDTSTPNEGGQNSDDPMEQEHGYNFEVPATEEVHLYDAVPLMAMGRFRHEAVAIDPGTGIVYQTEDRSDGLLYRFIPNKPGKLLSGGRLQTLRIKDLKRADTRNFQDATFKPGEKVAVEWLDIRDVESPDDDLRYQGYFESGAARFARAEGIWYGKDAIHFACTNGGHAKKGQIWRYYPSENEGTAREHETPAQLELFIEPNDGTLVENCDNVTLAPWGDLIICEDGRNPQYLVGVTPEGKTYHFARNNLSEFAGACFSPDGTTMFVNIFSPGMTLAITGPWEQVRPRNI